MLDCFPLEYFPCCLQQHTLEYEPVSIDKMYVLFHALEVVFVIVNLTKYSLKPEHIFVWNVFSELNWLLIGGRLDFVSR